MAKPAVHRLFYPNAKADEETSRVRPIVKASAVVDHRGVELEFLIAKRSYTPDELTMLARWLFSLAHETRELGASGLIDETRGYDVVTGKVVTTSS